MSQQQDKSSSDGTFSTLMLAVLFAGGAVGGTMMAVRVIPESHVAAVVGLLMLPLGVILGLSFGQHAAPTTALLNLTAVLNGRVTIEQIVARGGGSGGILSIAVAIVAGTVIVALAAAGFIDFFVKPPVAFGVIARWFGGFGLGFGLVSAALIWLLVE